MNRWLKQRHRTGGVIVPAATVWALANAWYKDPRDPAWKPRSLDEGQNVLSSVGLTGEFWQLK